MGQTMSRYKIIETFGEGGMSVIGTATAPLKNQSRRRRLEKLIPRMDCRSEPLLDEAFARAWSWLGAQDVRALSRELWSTVSHMTVKDFRNASSSAFSFLVSLNLTLVSGSCAALSVEPRTSLPSSPDAVACQQWRSLAGGTDLRIPGVSEVHPGPENTVSGFSGPVFCSLDAKPRHGPNPRLWRVFVQTGLSSFA